MALLVLLVVVPVLLALLLLLWQEQGERTSQLLGMCTTHAPARPVHSGDTLIHSLEPGS